MNKMNGGIKLPVKQVFLEEGMESARLGKEILRKLGGSSLPVKRVKPQEKGQVIHGALDRKSVYLTSFPGALLKPCPGTRHYICCGYQILHLGTNCPMDCTYCILQAYFAEPFMRVFVNLRERLQEVGEILDSQPGRTFRLGTGEFMDSLALDPLVGWSKILVPFISSRKNAVLEFKTKTDQVEGLLSLKERERIVISWSLNSPHVVAREEHFAPGLERRLEAARRCQEEGFVVGFHFDPIIEHADWKEQYDRAIDMMGRYIQPKGIIWISMGCLRYIPRLKDVIRKRHPRSKILEGEFVRGLDGKMRYFRPLRVEMYGHLAERLKTWSKDLAIYLCMESNEVWLDSLGWSPGDSEGLSAYLDSRVPRFFS
ncbi:MAG: DNA photolyase [Deltaproteobacteria bacterium]|nr:DNA photolyase [Deltaproteobacteria bacterium]